MDESFVYIIQRKHGSIKIGVAKDPEQRRKTLQTANHIPLRVIAALPCGSQDAAYRLERFLHKKLDKFRLDGEWFRKGAIYALRSNEWLPDSSLKMSPDALISVSARRREDAREKYSDLTREQLVDRLADVEWRLDKTRRQLEETKARVDGLLARGTSSPWGSKPRSGIGQRKGPPKVSP